MAGSGIHGQLEKFKVLLKDIEEEEHANKAINPIDEAASSLHLAQESKPNKLEALNREIMTLQIELESFKNETDRFSIEWRDKVEEELLIKRQEVDRLTGILQAEHFRLEKTN